MHESKRKEEISFSYLNALCAIAGVIMQRNYVDNGIDAYLEGDVYLEDGSPFKVTIAVQVKSTSGKLGVTANNTIKYPLKVRNHNILCSKANSQQLLFVLILPEKEEDWVNLTPDELIIRKCMYWLNLTGNQPSTNRYKVTVELPMENRLDSNELLSIMSKIAKDGVFYDTCI